MNRNIYREIAKKHGVTVEEVKREMQGAIDDAYADPQRDLINLYTQKKVPRRGETPTPDELVDFAAAEVRRREKGKK